MYSECRVFIALKNKSKEKKREETGRNGKKREETGRTMKNKKIILKIQCFIVASSVLLYGFQSQSAEIPEDSQQSFAGFKLKESDHALLQQHHQRLKLLRQRIVEDLKIDTLKEMEPVAGVNRCDTGEILTLKELRSIAERECDIPKVLNLQSSYFFDKFLRSLVDKALDQPPMLTAAMLSGFTWANSSYLAYAACLAVFVNREKKDTFFDKRSVTQPWYKLIENHNSNVEIELKRNPNSKALKAKTPSVIVDATTDPECVNFIPYDKNLIN